MHADPVLVTSAVVVVAGVAGQALARRLRLPAISPLLVIGVLLGPGGLGVIDPGALGKGLRVVVGFAVAIILFEGGMSLKAESFRFAGRAIRNLVSVGAVCTWVGAGVAAHAFFPELGWGLALLFGSLVIVTGPTVILPLVKVVRPRQRIADVLRGEAILIDPIGALYAVLVLEYLVEADVVGGGAVLVAFGKRILLGLLLGGGGAVLLHAALKRRHVLARDLHNLAVLAAAIGLYALSESLLAESGVLTVTLAGFLLGWLNPPGLEEVERFKGQLTLLMVAVVFVLLSANVDLAGMRQLGLAGLGVVALLMLVVRPVTVFLCTAGTELSSREKLFLSWVAPRGIIAAAVSSLFALILAEKGEPGGQVVMNLTFAVIVGTVVLQAPTARWVGRRLKVLEGARNGFLFVGANRIARALARALDRAGFRVELLDTNAYQVRRAREEGLHARRANAVDPLEIERLDLAGVGYMLALTPSDGVNRLAVQLYALEFGRENVRALRQASSPPEPDEETDPLYLLDERLTGEEFQRRLEEDAAIESAEVDERLEVARFGELLPGAVPLLVFDGEGLPRFLQDDDTLEVGDRLFYLGTPGSGGSGGDPEGTVAG